MIEKMSMISIDTIKNAESYINTARFLDNKDIALKFHEMAKEEVLHFDFIKKMIHENIDKNEQSHMEESITHKILKSWIDDVKTKVEIFKVK